MALTDNNANETGSSPDGHARTGVLGGSFDPVHLGHLLMAQDAIEFFNLDQVFFIPCAVPPHKGSRRLAAAEHRLAMLHRATASVDRFKVSDLEIRRGGRSFTIDTLQSLRSQHPDDDYFFIIGDDSLTDLPNWYKIDQLLDLCEFITLARPGVRLASSAPNLTPVQRNRLLAHRRVGHSINISATEIRERVASGRAISYLVPDPVADYITRYDLYRPHTKEDSQP